GQVVVTAKFREKGDHQQAGKTDRDLIQGTWKAIRVEEKGVAIPDDVLKRSTLTASVTGNDISLKEEPNSSTARLPLKGRFHLDPTKQPKAIDFFYLGEDAKPMLGIYRLEGDTLTLCWNNEPTQSADRPTEFSTKGKTWTLAVWQRVQKLEQGDLEKIQGT